MKKIEYIELYVANLPQSIFFYKNTFKFIPIAYSSHNQNISVLLQHGEIRIILTSSNDIDSDVSKHVYSHGDGVKEIAYQLDNVDDYFNRAVNNGAKAILYPSNFEQNGVKIRKATITAYGDTNYTFIQRDEINSNFLPNFTFYENIHYQNNTSLVSIDHIAVCVEQGNLQKWVTNHINVYGLKQSYEEYISTKNSSMNSIVVESKDGNVKIVFVEPGLGKIQSQVESYIKYYRGAGIQHVAFSTDDIIATVTELNNIGIDFLNIPDTYYEFQKSKLNLDENIFKRFKDLSILIDKSESGYLYQIFTKPVVSRPTLFFEIIQRIGCSGFGSGNIKALFHSIEQEQLKLATAKH